jgi:hypothetical protein
MRGHVPTHYNLAEFRYRNRLDVQRAYSINAIVHQERLDSGVDLIQKPITSEQLAAAVRKVLDS